MNSADAQRLAKARICAANNVDWYQSVFRAHALESERNGSHWQSSAAAPPFYSNFVTLDPEASGEQRAAIALLGESLHSGFALKDSFATLRLEKHGFAPLFDAQWIWLEASAALELAAPKWERVTSAAQLSLWEKGWHDAAPSTMQMFPPSLLEDVDVAFFGLKGDERYSSGCIANRSRECVGLSNYFAPPFDKAANLASAIAAVAGFGSGLPIVGYEHSEDLMNAVRYGFQTVGDLRIWVRET